MKKALLTIILLLITIAFTACNNTSDVYNDGATNNETIISETSATEETLVVQPDNDEETTTDVNLDEIIKDNPFSYKFQFIDDEKTLFYIAPISGIYRFDMSTDNVETNYKLKVYDSINQEIINIEYDNYQHGITTELVEEEMYRIVLSQDEGFPTATIKIGIPNETKAVSGNIISGTLNYIDQEDNYTFTPSVSGYYRFNFDTTNVKCDYSFILKDEINETLIDSEYSTYTNGANTFLEAEKEYSIKVIQDEGYVDYNIGIMEPQLPKIISNSFSDKITFIGQENIYYFTPKTNGTYNIYISFGDKQGCCKLVMRDEKNQELISTSSEYPKEVELIKGEKYTFVVSYDNMCMGYDVIIEKL
jgi:hypothetical protein